MQTDCEIPTQSFFCSRSTKGVFKKYQFNLPLEIQDQTDFGTFMLHGAIKPKPQYLQGDSLGEIVHNPGMKNAHLLMSVILDH